MSEHHHQLSMLHASPTYTSALSGEGNFSTGNPPSNNEKSANTYAMHSATEITITAISTIASILFIFCLLRYLFRRFRVKIFPLLGNLFAKLSRRRRRNVVQETVSQTNQQTAPSEEENDEFAGTDVLPAVHFPIHASDSFLEYAMAMPFLFPRAGGPFIEGHFFPGQFPPKYEELFGACNTVEGKSPNFRRPSRVGTATRRPLGRNVRIPSALPPPFYDESRNTSSNHQHEFNQSTSQIGIQNSESLNERPPAYSIVTAQTNSEMPLVLPINSISQSVERQPKELPELLKKFSRARCASIDGAFGDHPTKSILNEFLSSNNRFLAQSTSSLSAVNPDADIEAAIERGNRKSSVDARAKNELCSGSYSHRSYANNLQLNADRSERNIHLTRVPTPPLFTNTILPKLQRRLSFSLAQKENEMPLNFGRVPMAYYQQNSISRSSTALCTLDASNLMEHPYDLD